MDIAIKHRLILPIEVERKLHAYVMAVDSEIAGMGKIRREENGDIVVEDVMIYDQEVTGATADLSSEALAGFMTELIQKGESLAQWTLWWHSHHTMQAFFSGTDTGTIERSTEFDNVVSLVVNRSRERKCRIDTHRPYRMSILDVPVIVGTSIDEIPEDIRDEVREKVKIRSYRMPAYSRPWTGVGKDGERESWKPKASSLLPSPSEKSSKGGSGANSGSVRTAGEIILADSPDELDADEIMTILEVIEDQMRHLRSNGLEDGEKYHELASERADWQIELATRDTKDRVIGFHDGKA